MPGFTDRAARRLYQREYRRKKKLEAQEAARHDAPTFQGDPVTQLADWAARTLIVPAGHRNAGQPMVIQPWGVDVARLASERHAPGLSGPANRKRLIAWRRENGFCPKCGRPIPADEQFIHCPRCRQVFRDWEKRPSISGLKTSIRLQP